MSTISILLTDVAREEVFGDEVFATNFLWRSHMLADPELHLRLHSVFRRDVYTFADGCRYSALPSVLPSRTYTHKKKIALLKELKHTMVTLDDLG